MTLKELYDLIGGDYDQAMKVLRLEKLIDKHIRKFPQNAVFSELSDAGEKMDGNRIFESAHAVKGICSNLGLTGVAALAAEVCDEFRPERERTLSDEQIRRKIREIGVLFDKASEGIRRYEND
ncbi:MAG: Hpt domain-containing protein [Clostridia bacterium]|nr:Hpt domain-containing protein [Clostridia bacterium]